MDFRILAPGTRTLCRTLLAEGHILTMQVLTLDSDGTAVAEPFAAETAATRFEPSPVMLIRADCVTDTLLDDIAMIMKKDAPLREVNLYLSAAGLYSTIAGKGVAIAFS